MLILLHIDAAECKLFAGAALYGKGRRGHWLPDRDELAIIPVLKSAMSTPQPMPTTPDRSDPTRFVTVDIRDDGTGIDDEDLPDIFSPFFTRKRRGTGLGLAICDRTVKEHGGRLGVESHLGEGSVFKVSLPARQG